MHLRGEFAIIGNQNGQSKALEYEGVCRSLVSDCRTWAMSWIDLHFIRKYHENVLDAVA